MKVQHIALLLVSSHFSVSARAQRGLAWVEVQNLASGTPISVFESYNKASCVFQRATDDKLFCSYTCDQHSALAPQNRERTFERGEIRQVRINPSPQNQSDDVDDDSKGSLVMVLATGAGGGWNSAREPTSFGGVKLGIAGLTMDLQYDRLNAQNGFSVEGSPLLPLFRVPSFRPANDRLLFKAFAEPGLGYRTGPGPFGQYASAKVLVLLGNKWVKSGGPSPYMEFQRRFPFNSPLDGDNRIAVGIMWAALCWQCGGDY